MAHRVACSTCGQHRNILTTPACASCGEARWKTVIPTPGDLHASESAVIEAAIALDAVLLTGAVLTRSSESARRLAARCRELALTRAGIVCR